MRKNNFFSFQKEGKKKNLLLTGFFGVSLLFGGLNAHAQDYETMKISSGFNEDVIAENSPAADHSTSPVDGTASGANYALMTTDYPNAITGLPVNRIINSATTSELQFKLADFTENNSLRIASANGDGTLEFEEAVPALKLFILATSGNGNSTFTGTIHFSDDSTQEISSQTVNDWYNSPANIAIAGVGRVSRADGSVDNNTSNPKLFQIEITVEEENQEKEITQISFVKTSADGYLNIFGVSREFEADCPKPTGIAADNITPDSADLTWNEAADGTNWTIIYGEEGFNPEDEGTSEEVEDSSFSIEDLLPNTAYEVYIQAHCSETEDSNIAGPFSFTTACGSKDVPYILNFENVNTPEIPTCTVVETISGGKEWETKTQDNVPSMPSGFNGQVLVFTYTFSEPANAWFFSEGINLEAGVDYEISYKYANNSTTYVEKLKVSFGSSQDADGMTSDLADYPNISDGQLHQDEIVFTVDEDGVYYFGFQAYSATNQYNLIVDDIKIDVASGCIKPGELTAENITENSAEISWTSYNDENEWELVYGISDAGFDPETEGTTLTITDDAEITLEDLAINTYYTVYTKAICSDDEESNWSNPIQFKTACGVIDLPYFEDFNGTTTPAIPDCTSIETISGNEWKTTSFSPISSGAALLYSYDFSQPANSWFFTPPINLESGVNYQISYKYGNSSTSNWPESLKIAYGDLNSSANMDNDLADHVNFYGTHENEVFFTVPEDGIYYFGFQAHSDANQNQLYVDDIEIKAAPTCLPPLEFDINPTTDSVSISWTAYENDDQWEIVYGLEGFDLDSEGTSVIINDDAETTLNDLDSGTNYEFYIKTICAEDDESEWFGPVAFTTPCTAATVPFLQDFEDANVPEIPVCATLENAGSGNNWETYDQNAPGSWTSTDGFDGKVLAYEYNLNNAANAWYFTQGIELEAGINYELSYKYGKGDINSVTIEKLRVKMGTSPSSSAMDTELADHPHITQTTSETNSLIVTVEDDGVYYFGFQAYSDTNQWYLFLDDISIDVGPTCPAPTDINFEYITDISAMVNFTSGQENTSWEIIYGEAGFDPETEGETLTTQETSGNLISGLTAETSYDVYVRAICEEEVGEIAGPASFTTAITPPENTYLCDAIEIFANDACANGPYTNADAFEEANEPFGECLNNFHGTNSVWFTFVATSDQAVVTTDFASTEFATEISVFAAPTDCTDMTTLGEEAGCAANGNDADLSGLIPGDTYYIKITGFNNAAGEFCIEVQMDEPACPAPSDISFGEITENSAEVNWISNGTETEWEVIYGLTGFDLETEGASILVTENPQVVLTDLEEDTQYDVYVRAICEGDEFSDWISGDFTTEEMGVAAYIFDNFTYYPNPTQGEITLKASEQIESIRIINLLGQEVLNFTPNQTQTQLKLHQLQPAVYLMEVSINGTSKTFRVVKK